MIDRLRAYRCSQAAPPWLGSVPQHWAVLPARTLFEERRERGHEDEPLLSITIGRGVIRQSVLLEGSSKKDTSNLDKSKYKLVRSGDIAYNKMRAWQGAVGLSNHQGIVSPAYIVLRPRKPEYGKYCHHLFRTPGFAKEAERWSYGIVSDQWSLRPEHFRMIYCPVPPPDEQAAVVKFIDHADRKIRRYIRAKQRLLNLHREAISSATDAAMNHPTRRIVRLRTVAVSVHRLIDRQPETSYTPVGLYNRGRGMFAKAPAKGKDLGDSSFFWLKAGDLIISGQFAWEGAVALVPQDLNGCVASHRYPVLAGRGNLALNSYLAAVFRSSYGHLLLNLNSRGAAGRNRPLNIGRLLKEEIAVPALPVQPHFCKRKPCLETMFGVRSSVFPSTAPD